MAQAAVHIDFQPIGRRIQIRPGATLLEAAQQAGVGLVAVCGGSGVCGTCRVRVLAGQVNPPTPTEKDELAAEDLAAGLRLACQVEVQGDIRVDVPRESLSAPQRTQVEGESLDVPLAPAVIACDVCLEPAAQTDLRSDWTRLLNGLTTTGVEVVVPQDRFVLAALPPALRDHGWRVRAAVRGHEVIAVGAVEHAPLGFAVDVGTTKLAGYLVDLTTGRTLAMDGRMNPQIAYGEDVMARISHAIQGADHAATLQQAIAGALNEMLIDLCRQAGARLPQVVDAVMVGNTAMHHLLAGLPVAQLGTAPYVAAVSDALDLKARDLGLEMAPGAYVHLLPNIAGFVGADHVAMLLATDTPGKPGVTISLDIGTNTEISLNAHGRLLACSTASGPAFEGAHIRDGMRAAVGAIERVRIADGRLSYQTVGGARPVGICGSGILDAIAQLRRAGALTEQGALLPFDRVRAADHGAEFVLATARESGHGRDVTLSRSDVGEIQLAKAAIRAGMRILLEEVGLTEADLDRVIVAGAFGTYIDVDSAITVGMFPPLPRERYFQVGNAAGMGARQCVLSVEQRRQAQQIARRVDYLELTNDRRFTDRFTQALALRPDCWDAG